jgi:hypothetical protein
MRDRNEDRVQALRLKLDGAYKESIELGVKCFKKGDTEREVRRYMETALSNYRWRLMEIMRVQMIENEMDEKNRRN